MDTIDITTLYNIISNLVTVPEDIKIDRKVDEQGVLLSVLVNSKDMGILIGKSGVMANSIKTIMRAIGKAHKMNIRVDFLEPDGSTRFSKSEHSYSGEAGGVGSYQNDSSLPVNSIDDDLTEFVIN
jgi:predicted RNA-binding protein YlqC (UPF0109 family)